MSLHAYAFTTLLTNTPGPGMGLTFLSCLLSYLWWPQPKAVVPLSREERESTWPRVPGTQFPSPQLRLGWLFGVQNTRPDVSACNSACVVLSCLLLAYPCYSCKNWVGTSSSKEAFLTSQCWPGCSPACCMALGAGAMWAPPMVPQPTPHGAVPKLGTQYVLDLLVCFRLVTSPSPQ